MSWYLTQNVMRFALWDAKPMSWLYFMRFGECPEIIFSVHVGLGLDTRGESREGPCSEHTMAWISEAGYERRESRGPMLWAHNGMNEATWRGCVLSLLHGQAKAVCCIDVGIISKIDEYKNMNYTGIKIFKLHILTYNDTCICNA